MKPLRAVIGIVVSVSSLLAAPGTARRTAAGGYQGLDEFVTATMREWHVPGLALGVIKDGKVALTKGYGYRDVEKQLFDRLRYLESGVVDKVLVPFEPTVSDIVLMRGS